MTYKSFGQEKQKKPEWREVSCIDKKTYNYKYDKDDFVLANDFAKAVIEKSVDLLNHEAVLERAQPRKRHWLFSGAYIDYDILSDQQGIIKLKLICRLNYYMTFILSGKSRNKKKSAQASFEYIITGNLCDDDHVHVVARFFQTAAIEKLNEITHPHSGFFKIEKSKYSQ